MSQDITARRLRAGIVGGGRGAFIGSVHRIAAELDGQANVVAGALSSNAAIARESAAAWFLDRSYDSFEAMARAEAARPDGIDFVIVATPNQLHFPVAQAFLDAGIHVMCDKPLAFTLAEAEQLAARTAQGKTLLGLTHTYTGYPAVREARELVRAGSIGALRKVLVGGAKGTLTCSQVACGEENNLWIRIYGTKAGLEWHQQEPNTLILKPAGEPWRLLRAAGGYMSEAAKAVTRTPGGHPEGYLEAFANLYRAFIADIRRVATGERTQGGYASTEDGLRGMRFIARAVESSAQGSRWVQL